MIRKLSVIILFSIQLAACSDSKPHEISKSEQYLDRLAGIVCSYNSKHGALPEQFDEALNESGKTLPNHGDYHGKNFDYAKLGEDQFYLQGSDAAVYYTGCKKTTTKEFYSKAQATYTGMAKKLKLDEGATYK